MPLFVALEQYYPKKIFLDVQARFAIHNLETIVSKTKLFIFIVTYGIFNSYWCRKGMEISRQGF